MSSYSSASNYINSAKDLYDRIKKIDEIINALLSSALGAASTDHIEEYMLNDGQTIIKASYRGLAGIQAAIRKFESIKQMYVNQLEGRVIKLKS